MPSQTYNDCKQNFYIHNQRTTNNFGIVLHCRSLIMQTQLLMVYIPHPVALRFAAQAKGDDKFMTQHVHISGFFLQVHMVLIA